MSVHELFPYLRVRDGRAAIGFYARVFGTTERLRLTDPTDGRIGHAELVFPGGQVLMLSGGHLRPARRVGRRLRDPPARG